jgi:hypothetical protein
LFLVPDFGYRQVRRRFRWGGFELAYQGDALGVLVEWYPRDPLTVWLVRLVNGVFPPRGAVADAAGSFHYFDLRDLEIIKTGRQMIDERQLYGTPDERTASLLADSLRQQASDLLRGDMREIQLLETRIRERIATAETPPRRCSERGFLTIGYAHELSSVCFGSGGADWYAQGSMGDTIMFFRERRYVFRDRYQ